MGRDEQVMGHASVLRVWFDDDGVVVTAVVDVPRARRGS
jgi:hypothetical protein